MTDIILLEKLERALLHIQAKLTTHYIISDIINNCTKDQATPITDDETIFPL